MKLTEKVGEAKPGDTVRSPGSGQEYLVFRTGGGLLGLLCASTFQQVNVAYADVTDPACYMVVQRPPRNDATDRPPYKKGQAFIGNLSGRLYITTEDGNEAKNLVEGVNLHTGERISGLSPGFSSPVRVEEEVVYVRV